jgi:hypothetical protein
MAEPIQIFVSYAHQDSRWLGDDSLIPWLARSLRRDQVVFWWDREGILPGDEYRKLIEKEIGRSAIAVLLVSQEFLNSEFIEEVELPLIRARSDAGQMLAIPILLEPCGWEELGFLSDRQMVPGKPTPLIEFAANERDWVNARAEILSGIRRLIGRLRSKPASKTPEVDGSPDDEDANSLFQRAEKYWSNTNDRDIAARLYLQAAEMGHVEAQWKMGLCYQTGRGVSEDLASCLHWYQAAAEQGLVKAQFQLAVTLMGGRLTGFPKTSDEQAAVWFRKAAEAGESRAAVCLGDYYKDGQGVPQSDEEARRWYTRALELGNTSGRDGLEALKIKQSAR